LEQVKVAHKTEIESITASHEEALNSNVKALEKQISALKLELSATQDDLAKAKGALTAATSETDNLKTQLEQAAKDAEAASTAAGSEKEAALADLTKRLNNTQQELSDLNVRTGLVCPSQSLTTCACHRRPSSLLKSDTQTS
jgi:conserved oligomeric Golgi complex subunit 6